MIIASKPNAPKRNFIIFLQDWWVVFETKKIAI